MATATRTQEDTRQQLLEAAGEVFAEQGFRAATVREICRRAAANVAAVNYYFGGKEGLYTEVLRLAHHCSVAKYPPNMGLAAGAAPAERLHAFVRSFLWRIFDQGQPSWHGKLMSREMVEPTAALDSLVEENVRPRAELLESIVRALMGPGARAEDVRLASMSVVAQCLFYFHSRPVIERLYPQQSYAPKDIERLADHITRFSLAALAGWRLRRRRGGAP
jgi:AcrR family transcriptional regulator